MITLLILTFVMGYACIIAEEMIKINKAAIALLTGVLCWTIYILSNHNAQVVENQLVVKFSEAAELLFFLLGAMALVEVIDAHDGFDIIISRLTTRRKASFLLLITVFTFFLSAILDNLTTTIVMVSFVRKLIGDREERLRLVGMIIIAANAGGAWSPMGDVTTTMLWIGGQVTAWELLKHVFLPSIACVIVPLLLILPKFKGHITFIETSNTDISNIKNTLSQRHQYMAFFVGIGGLLFVPIFKTITHLPPFMGMLLSLGSVWTITELMHSHKNATERDALSVKTALERVDTPSILFFVGILLAVGALEVTSILRGIAVTLSHIIENPLIISIILGFVSAVFDNVPLVAASMGMYNMTIFHQDHAFWHFMAYCAGTGGSLLIIGSAAGVAAMGMERIGFLWYLKNMTWLAAMGYVAGCAVFLLEHIFFT